MNVIETHGLKRSFGLKDAVRGLDLKVPAGVVCALLGPNGAGKTTTIKMLMGLLAPSGGHASVLGTDVRRLGATEKTRIGYVSENQELPEWMTVRRFLDSCRGFYPAWDEALEQQLLAKLALPEDRKIKQLSRGMRMKVALLAALAYRPELLVLDEPFSGLDPAMRDDLVRGVFAAVNEGKWTVLISSHDIDEVERIADWIAIMDDGRLRLSESLEALQARYRRVDVTLREGTTVPDGDLPEAWTDVEQEGLLLRFVETGYHGSESERGYATRFPGAEISMSVMTLRDTYLAAVRMPQLQPGFSKS
jgi:ABC-2 type transport system ATP-binding protein